MNINGKAFRTIWVKPGDEKVIQIIDQRHLPHQFIVEDLETVDQMAIAIKDMHLRGAGLIGAAAGFGMYLATLEAPANDSFDASVLSAAEQLKATRPTAVNLAWAVDKQLQAIQHGNTIEEKINIAFTIAKEIADEDAEYCRRIGEHGLKLIEAISKKKNAGTVNILTHCNAGWLAFVDYGSASSAIYAAHDKGINVHVWVDETRPRNQGASLTAWEMAQHGVPNTIIADNTGGHLMQHGMVDMVIVGSDRTTYTGDVANKIGTYLKALAANDNNIPFYAALPSSSIDWQMEDGLKEIIIEERNGDEVKYMEGLCDGEIKKVLLTPVTSRAANYAFDVTPARLVTGIITERGICEPNKESILHLFPEKNNMDEGYIKFNCNWIPSNDIPLDKVAALNVWRGIMYKKRLIGVYPDGIGFGNISMRCSEKTFLISGTATGGLATLNESHYSMVTDYDLSTNSVTCVGPLKASSESLTHALIYECSAATNAVIHIHDLDAWNRLMHHVPTSSEAVPYGTPAMANEIKRLFDETALSKEKILVMGGHTEGIISFGKDLEEAGNILIDKLMLLI